MLHQRVGEIFLENESAGARTDFSDSLRRFLVPDRGTDRNELSVVLLAESPNTDEVFSPEIGNRYPLAATGEGSPGLRVRNKLTEWIPALNLPEQPIGQLVHQVYNTVQQLGIMNVSRLPFQRGAYKYHHIPQRENDCRAHANWDDYITCMKYIREHPVAKTYMSKNDTNRTQRWQELRCKIDLLEHAIIEDLAGRLESIGGNVQVMCLGEVAQIFYLKSLYYRNTNGYILDFPYPSSRPLHRRYWANLAPQNDQRLQGIIDHIQPP